MKNANIRLRGFVPALVVGLLLGFVQCFAGCFDVRAAEAAEIPDVVSSPEYLGIEAASAIQDRAQIVQLGDDYYDGWLAYCEQRYDLQLADEVADAEGETGIPGWAILAVCWKESDTRQFRKNGKPVVGDGGRSWGIGQIQYRTWEPFYEKELGEALDLRYSRRDNLRICAHILKRGGWTAGDLHSQLVAYGYYNSGKRRIVRRYSYPVARKADAIKSFEGR